jgi:hypothetical protein
MFKTILVFIKKAYCYVFNKQSKKQTTGIKRSRSESDISGISYDPDFIQEYDNNINIIKRVKI